MKKILLALVLVLSACNVVEDEKPIIDEPEVIETPVVEEETNDSYVIVDTNQNKCYSNNGEIDCSDTNYPLQDGAVTGNQMSYTDHGDGTVTDENTGLMWQKDPGDKQTYQEAINGVSSFTLAGYNDWRVPTIKELYSLMDFSGVDIDPMATTANTPFINTDFFDFCYGDTESGDRIIDSQWVTSTVYQSTVMSNQECFFGVNFADGRIKCYPTTSRKNNGYFAIYVRGNDYGENGFSANGEVISDANTNLMWSANDSEEALNWSEALTYCSDLTLATYDDWRLPNAKELHSIVDYSRSPSTTNSAALDAIFKISTITNEAGETDYPAFWTSTTHLNSRNSSSGVYITFGKGMGNMSEFGGWIDVHGAGAQRSDPKKDNGVDYSDGHGPQGDAIRIYNYARCVRTAN